MASSEASQIFTVEWHMLDKKKFFPLSMVSSFTIRCFLYPFTVIKTRIQVQRQQTMYTGTFDAFQKTLKYEGLSGLYKGFWINTIQIFSGVFYMTTYESVRHLLKTNALVNDSKVRSLIAGGCASVVGQTIIVPFDVVSQYMMVLGQVTPPGQTPLPPMNPLNIRLDSKNRWDVFSYICREVYRRDGFRGFYRGYVASLCTYVPNSALWWCFYHFYCEQLIKWSPPWTSHLMLQCLAGPLAGVSSAIITNPMDIVRARLQVQRLSSFTLTFQLLWKEEKAGMFVKGLSARLIQSISFSFMIILGYETIKRWSISEEYKHRIKW